MKGGTQNVGRPAERAVLVGIAYASRRDEEPGKILHELRFGELTSRGQRPHSPYFGSAVRSGPTM